MVVLQLACVAIVALWIGMRLRREPAPRRFIVKLLVIAVAAWLGEETCIRLYGFYAYAPGWAGFVDRVPVAIVCIWPVVVVSAMDLASALTTGRMRTALLVMLLVIADASLIEPIAVASGLWSWTVPGPFSVPIIGILGWGFFAVGAALVRGRPIVLLAGPIGAHILLLSTWWAALRWLPRGEDERPFVVVAWLVSAMLTALIVTRKVTLRPMDLWLRVPAASFFFVLLALFARDQVLLVAYAIAFAPPYLALTALAHRRRL